jgi:dTDP-4-amino-4,6-dideoxygalactose transaminase
MDNIQAAVLLDKIAWYDQAIARRREIAAKYHEGLCDIAALQLPPAPGTDPRRFDTFQNYDVYCEQRDALREHLAAQGIGTILHWGGIGLHRFRKLGLGGSLPNTDRFLGRALLLPMNHMLRDDQVARTIAAVRSFF